MSDYRRHYGALKDTHQEVAEDLTRPAPEPAAMSSRPTAELMSEEQILETRAALHEELQQKYDRGLIRGHEIPYQLAKFDNAQLVDLTKAQTEEKAEALREARALAAAAREHEAVEQARGLEHDGLER